MNVATGSSRNGPQRAGPRRAGSLAAALAAIAMLATACGSGNPPAAGSKTYQKALAFAQCMRSHGAPTFPDPTSQGTFTISQTEANSPLTSSAARACKKLLPPGAVPVPAAQQPKLVNQALQYAACMRSHGIPNFPEPTVHNGSVGITLPNGIDPTSPQFQSAQRACHKLMPGAP